MDIFAYIITRYRVDSEFDEHNTVTLRDDYCSFASLMTPLRPLVINHIH